MLNALCEGGDTTVVPTGTPRVAAISALTLAPGSTPPSPGLAPWDSLIEMALTAGSCAFSANFVASKLPSCVAAAEVPRTDLPDQVAAGRQVVRTDPALAGVVGESAPAAPPLSASIALADSAPKLIAETLSSAMSYGCVQSGPPRRTRGARSEAKLRAQGMPQEFVAERVDIAFSTERFVALGALGPLVDHVAGLAVERCAVGVGLDEVLLDLRADGLQQKRACPRIG